jgi:hypothetical protein
MSFRCTISALDRGAPSFGVSVGHTYEKSVEKISALDLLLVVGGGGEDGLKADPESDRRRWGRCRRMSRRLVGEARSMGVEGVYIEGGGTELGVSSR